MREALDMDRIIYLYNWDWRNQSVIFCVYQSNTVSSINASLWNHLMPFCLKPQQSWMICSHSHIVIVWKWWECLVIEQCQETSKLCKRPVWYVSLLIAKETCRICGQNGTEDTQSIGSLRRAYTSFILEPRDCITLSWQKIFTWVVILPVQSIIARQSGSILQLGRIGGNDSFWAMICWDTFRFAMLYKLNLHRKIW